MSLSHTSKVAKASNASTYSMIAKDVSAVPRRSKRVSSLAASLSSITSMATFYKKTKKTKIEKKDEEEDVKKTSKKRRIAVKEQNSTATAKDDAVNKVDSPRKRKSAKKVETKKESSEESKGEVEENMKEGDYLNRDLKPSADGKVRCWSSPENEMRNYHDTVWGLPPPLPTPSSSSVSSTSSAYSSDEVSPYISFSESVFNQLTLQLFQAGISWSIIFKKRHSIASAFSNYSFASLPLFSQRDVERLLQNAAIIRNRRKIEAVINNAQQALRIEKREKNGGGFGLWLFSQQFVMQMPVKERKLATGRHLNNHMRQDGFKIIGEGRFESDGVHPTDSVTKMTQLLKSEGFKHLGETTVLSFMQAVGMMNHHADKCYVMELAESRWKQLMQLVKSVRKIK